MKTIAPKAAAAILVMTGLMAMGSGHRAGAQLEQRENKLEGTWSFQVSLENCANGQAIGQPFQSLLTFNEGGTMTETTSNPIFYPADRGPGHGVWSQVSNHTFQATSVAFITLNGALQKLQTIEQTIQLTRGGDLKTIKAQVKFNAPDGTLLMEGCASATGKRLELAGVE